MTFGIRVSIRSTTGWAGMQRSGTFPGALFMDTGATLVDTSNMDSFGERSMTK
jgi:hypothetical protein